MTQHNANMTPAKRTPSGALSRRQFLTRAASAIAAPQIVPASALGRGGATAPSERITLGSIGVGGRGTTHVRTFLGYPDVQVLAVCDPYQSKCDAAKQLVDERYAGCATYQDFRPLIARDDIDAVVIASPEHWHGLHGALAAEAGKDIYGEKALTLTVKQGRALVDRVRRHGRIFQVGLQQRSSRDFRFACELARNGYLGALRKIEVGVPGGRALEDAPTAEVPPGLDYDIWLGPAPWTPYNELKCTFNWYFIYDYCVGWIQSWGAHHIDIAQWGAPDLTKGRLKVSGAATFPTAGLADTSVTWRVECRTENGLVLSFADNGHHEQGCRFEGDKGWVHVNRSGIKAEPAALLTASIKAGEERLYVSDNHHANFIECVRTRRDPAARVEDGHSATTITIVSDIATRLGRELTWDWEAERFVDDQEASRMLGRAMRSPWTL